MTQEQLLIMKYLAKDGYKDFNGELLPNGNRPLGKQVSEDRSLGEQYEDALSLELEGFLNITDVQKGVVGNSNVLRAVRVELVQKGIQYIEENKNSW